MTFEGQIIHFGLALDGERGWKPANALGESRLGPLGFLSLLEAQLGVLHPHVSSVERVAQMAACLHQAKTGSRFYEASLKVDEIGTASTLLRWRDVWNEAGWRGEPASEKGRIADMAAVEVHARKAVGAGVAERLAEVEAMLELRDPGIRQVLLVDALEEHSTLWRRVLAKLPFASAGEVKAQGAPGTMLRKLQDALAESASGGKPATLAWQDDGTLRVVRGETSLAASAWLGAELKLASPDLLLVVEQEGGIADANLAAADLALQGVSPSSHARPALQVLPLALRLLWTPLDFSALLAFLTLPDGPLPRFARRPLAEQVATSPGIGGEGWNHTIEQILEKREKSEDKAALRDGIAYWLESERFDPSVGAPIAVVIDRTMRLADRFRAGTQSDDESRATASQDGLAQASALAAALRVYQSHGKARVSGAELDRLVSQATGSGSRNPERVAQAGSRCVVSDPGAALEAFDEVFWWRMASILIPRPDPWSGAELEALQSVGAALVPARTRLAAQARGWLAPILQARKRLTLMLPRAGDETHPVWVQINALVDGAVVRDIEDVLTTSPSQGITAAIAYRPRQTLRRWWRLPPEAKIPWPAAHSFSSLEKLVFDPVQWLLQYAAAIRPSSLLELPSEPMLYGKVSHRIIESLYGTPGALEWPKAQVEAWLDACLDRVVAEEGAILLQPGRRSDLETLRLVLRRAVMDLHGRLQKAGARQVWSERELVFDTELGSLKGILDLHLELATGLGAVVDMKWSSSTYADKVTEGRHVQLAIYGRLVQALSGRWPAVAYYILRRQQLATRDVEVFDGQPDAATYGDTSQLWQKVVDCYRWRNAQFEAGQFELVRDGLPPEPDDPVAPDGLAILPLNLDYNSFRFLDGWRAGE